MADSGQDGSVGDPRTESRFARGSTRAKSPWARERSVASASLPGGIGASEPQEYVPASASPTATSGTPTDDGGVGRLELASLIGLIGQVLIWAVGLPVFIWLESTTPSAARLGSNLGPAINTIPGWSSPNWFYLSMGSLTVGFILGMVSFILFYLGFRAAAWSAPDSRPRSGSLVVGFLGYLLLAAASVDFAGAMASAIGSAGPASISSGNAGLNMNAVWTGVILLSVGGFSGIFGTIGLVLANWRAGSRFADSGLRVGAILTTFPFMAVAGQALLIRGYSTVAAKFRAVWASPSETFGCQTSPLGSPAPSLPAPSRSRHWRKAHPPPQ